ncbi:MAG: DinB family protein [Anaerolineales bacterium]
MMANETPDRMTPAQLWAEILKARAQYSAVYAGLSDEEMTRRPGAQEDWSVKDQIAHLTWWEDYAIVRSGIMLAGEPFSKLTDFDAINAQVFAFNRDVPLKDVLAAFAANLSRLEGLCSSLNEERLNDEVGTSQPPYWLLVTDTFEHYREHQPDLERYVASLKK